MPRMKLGITSSFPLLIAYCSLETQNHLGGVCNQGQKCHTSCCQNLRNGAPAPVPRDYPIQWHMSNQIIQAFQCISWVYIESASVSDKEWFITNTCSDPDEKWTDFCMLFECWWDWATLKVQENKLSAMVVPQCFKSRSCKFMREFGFPRVPIRALTENLPLNSFESNKSHPKTNVAPSLHPTSWPVLRLYMSIAIHSLVSYQAPNNIKDIIFLQLHTAWKFHIAPANTGK